MVLFINLFQEAAILMKILDCYLIKMKPLYKYELSRIHFSFIWKFFKPSFNPIKIRFKEYTKLKKNEFLPLFILAKLSKNRINKIL
ncbi:hypothetical protein BROOK1789C_1519 [Bathymodiolus brooksi thiotrophic gill symbiont]|nr:hypothetical protein BROOK1789C_1519 [Bathymodiolus brooksi thiotrophic gill symbiont]